MLSDSSGSLLFYSNAFYSFLLTANGIKDTVISNAGTAHQDFLDAMATDAAIGQMKVSPDGSKLALVFSNTTPSVAELFDFDNTTGLISNAVSLPVVGSEYGVSFSPDNSKLYVKSGCCAFHGLQLGPDGKIYIASHGKDFLSVIQRECILCKLL